MSHSEKKKIEPHVILHLKITQDDINKYLQYKIQTDQQIDKELLKNTMRMPVYEPNNIDMFTNPKNNSNPSPANLEDEHFELIHEKKEEKDDVFLNQPIESHIENENKYYLSFPYIHLNEIDIPVIPLTDDINCSDIKIKHISVLCEFAEANKRKEWLKNTNIWCKWCVHPFSLPPISIPKYYINNTFFVSGCYCSFNCAAKHLFYRGDITDTNKWNYYNLLHLLKQKMLGSNNKIKLAPPQDTLKIFGGHLSIEEFRKSTLDSVNKSYNIIEPPIISIIPNIEEISYAIQDKDTRSCNMKYSVPNNEINISNNWDKNKSFIPVDKDRMKRAVDNLKIKRKTPLLDKKKTLLHYMNLKINKNSKSDIDMSNDCINAD